MVYVTGDLHGDINRFSQKNMKKLKKGDTLIVCGDFGFIWEGCKEEEKTLKKLGKKKYNILFVDGSHENHFRINTFEEVLLFGGVARQISGKLHCLKRGGVYNIEGLRIFAMGGANSPDEEYRVNTDESFPTIEELKEANENLKSVDYEVDYIITHDACGFVKSFIQHGDIYLDSLNTFFDSISNTCKYKRWFFGRYHLDRVITKTQTALYKDVIML